MFPEFEVQQRVSSSQDDMLRAYEGEDRVIAKRLEDQFGRLPQVVAEPNQIFRFPNSETIVHSNIPHHDFFQPVLDGIRRKRDMQVRVSGGPSVDIDLVGGSLRSIGKEKRDVIGGDHILYNWLRPDVLVVGVIDGISMPFAEKDVLSWTAPALFDEEEMGRLDSGFVRQLLTRTIPGDAYAGLLVSKFFPLSDEYNQLKNIPNVSAKDIMLAADKYVGRQLAIFPFNNMPNWSLPSAVATIAVIDFSRRIISTAHIGDPTIGYEPWVPEYRKYIRENTWDNQSIKLAESQNTIWELKKYLEMQRYGIKRTDVEYHDATIRNFIGKRNKKGGVGIIDGHLLPDLIQSREIHLDQVLSLLLYTDGFPLDLEEMMNAGYAVLFKDNFSFFRRIREVIARSNLLDIVRDDDLTQLMLSFRNSGHCQTSDYLGMARLINRRASIVDNLIPSLFNFGGSSIESLADSESMGLILDRILIHRNRPPVQ